MNERDAIRPAGLVDGAVPARTPRGTGRRLHGAIAYRLGTAILSGEYAPGDKLPGEIEFSESLDVSRSAYREAMQVLTAKGLVESRPKAGTRVCPRARWNLLDPDVLGWILENDPEPAFLRELFELRLAIEPRLAELAAERRTEVDLAALKAAVIEMEGHEPDSEAAEEADRRFHEAVISASGNELMGHLTSTISASVVYVARQKRKAAAHRDSTADHRLLMEAIAIADVEAARASASRIISRGLADLRFDR